MIANRNLLSCLFFVLLVSVPLYAGNGPGYGREGGGGGNAVSALTEQETEDLLFMREEEKMARDVYNELYEFYKANDEELLIFANIGGSEQQHMDAMLGLLDKYGLEDPAADAERGLFENETLSALYRNLVSDSSANLPVLNEPVVGGKVASIYALYVGAWIEERDMIDILQAISNTDQADIAQVYTNLLCGSRNHLRAFVGRIGGDIYPAQILLDGAQVQLDTDPRETLSYWLGDASDEICF